MNIIISENQFKKITGVPSKTLLEQVAIASEENTLTIVQQKKNLPPWPSFFLALTYILQYTILQDIY